MDLLGWTLAVVGAALYVAALVRAVRANPTTTIPYVGPPRVAPPGTIALRLGGTGMLVLGAVLLVPVIGTAAILLVVAGPLLAAGVTSLHNARVSAKGR